MPTQPSRSDVHVDRPLSNVSVALLQSQDRFIADKAFPIVSVVSKSDQYFTYDRGMFNRDEMTELAPGVRADAANYTLSTDTYNAKVYALAHDIADQVRANADSQVSLDREATEFLTIKALIKKEKLWAAAHFITGVWTSELTGVSGAPAGGQFQRWDEAASTPIEVMRDSIRTVHELTGFRPDRLVLQRTVYDKLLDHPDIVGRLDRGQGTGPAMAKRDSLAALFELKEILIMDSIENTSAEGVANSHSFIGGKHALLLYTPPSAGLMTPSAGYTFSWAAVGSGLGTRMKRMRMEPEASDRLQIEMSFDQKQIAADLGFFFLDAVN